MTMSLTPADIDRINRAFSRESPDSPDLLRRVAVHRHDAEILRGGFPGTAAERRIAEDPGERPRV